jgi:hypothetical protein
MTQVSRRAPNDLPAPAALPCGDPDRSAAPHGPAVCLLDGLPSLSRSGVKGRCALMSARWAFGPPLTPPRPGWAGATGRPERARSSARPAGSTRRDGMRQFEQDWLELGSRVARSLHYQARRWQRMAAWQLEAARRTP